MGFYLGSGDLWVGRLGPALATLVATQHATDGALMPYWDEHRLVVRNIAGQHGQLLISDVLGREVFSVTINGSDRQEVSMPRPGQGLLYWRFRPADGSTMLSGAMAGPPVH
ncbi:MAG: hypothetical protein ABI432_08980 [Flavobacteriales bacterium]